MCAKLHCHHLSVKDEYNTEAIVQNKLKNQVGRRLRRVRCFTFGLE
jgi:hypothetical protein